MYLECIRKLLFGLQMPPFHLHFNYFSSKQKIDYLPAGEAGSQLKEQNQNTLLLSRHSSQQGFYRMIMFDHNHHFATMLSHLFGNAAK